MLTYELVPCKVKLPDMNRLPPIIVSEETFNEPVIEASLLTLNPFGLTDAVTEPLVI